MSLTTAEQHTCYLKGTCYTKSGDKTSFEQDQWHGFSKDGYLVNKWDSAKDAEKMLGVGGPQIAKCCKGKVKTAGGYMWKYYDKETYLIGIMNNNIKKGAA